MQQVTDFFVRVGSIDNAVPAAAYFDPNLFVATVRG